MTGRKLTLFLVVMAIALQPGIAYGFPSQRYSPNLMQSTSQNAVDTPDSTTYRFLKQMELDQIMQRQYSSVEPINSDLSDPGIPLNSDRTPEEGLDEELEMALQQSKVDARKADFYQRVYYDQQSESMYRQNDPMRMGGVKFVPEEETAAIAGALASRQGFDMGNNFPVRAEDILQRMTEDDMENTEEGYYSERAEDLQELIRQEEIEEKNIFREEDSLRQQELLDQAIRQEEMLQDITLREASSLRQISPMRNGDGESDPLQQFEIARDAFIYKEEIRQDMLRQQAVRQEILRQEALRQEKLFEENPERQYTTLHQESEILQQLIRQEELRQENARNLEDAYRDEAAGSQNDPDTEKILLQKAQFQESIRLESEKRQEEAIRQSDILRKKVYNKKKILQQVCINCGPKIVSVSNSNHIQI